MGFPLHHIKPSQPILLPIYQFTNAASPEETFFKGFLWGTLGQEGLKDSHTFLIQAVVFWLAHIYYTNTYPLSFWIIVPMGAVFTGLLAWGPRSVPSAMIAHGVLNGIGQAIAFHSLE